MVDIETLGLEPGAAIISIGAIRFDQDVIHETFERSISLESCQETGLTIDANTLEWWLEQDDAAQHVLTGGDPLPGVLSDFSAFYGDADEIWANSPSFDCEMLERAYAAVNQDEPWDFRDERCFRTLASLPVDVTVDHDGVEHDALDDAQHQATVAIKVLERLEGVDSA
jgi:DNA polymerase III epsilon subunit-like protein